MKKSILFIVAVLCLSSCKDKLLDPVKFDVTFSQDSLTLKDSVYHMSKGTTIDFLFSGEPDYISSYYSIFNETEVSLSFVTTVSWYVNKDNLHVYVSDAFPGLKYPDFEADKTLVQNFKWTEITDQCKIPTQKDGMDTTFINMNAYKDKSVTLAFRYLTTDTKTIQPMFTLSQLQMDSYIPKTGELINSQTSQTMAFQPIDMMGTDSASVYESSTAGGKWDVSLSDPADRTAIKIRHSFAGKPANDDWIVSRTFTVPRGKEQLSAKTPIKNIHTTDNHYKLQFNEAGEWTVYFYASNANYRQKTEITKVFHFFVTDKTN